MHDHKLFAWASLLLILPLTLAFCGHDQFRYPCQDPKNWDSPDCKPPICDVTRTCPEQIFKGQRDPRLGPPPPADQQGQAIQTPIQSCKPNGVSCGK